MRGCGCLLMMVLGSLMATGFAVLLALQPIGETPPAVTPEAAASFDQKMIALMAPAGGASFLALSEQELNAKLAKTLAGAPTASPLKRLFVRVRPDNHLTAVGLGEVFGRPVGGKAELQLVNGDGVSVTIQSAHIGTLPLPVSLFTEFVFPMIQNAGLSLPSASALPQGVKSARTEGENLILSR